jgi:predicted AAA+ superfamily ATPase
MAELGLKQALVITEDYEGEETISNGTVKYTSLWYWLLER